MYKKFFRLRERPFKLVPDPNYLVLSKNHEEVLAHLNYALLQGDGFVEITGEVGTGKTTLCRAFLEKVDEDKNTETAYIVNPKLDEIQLLKVINDEFGISSDKESIKELVDILNNFLIEKKAEGKKVILIVDEAQNLSMEVLEQLRLISNLETTSSKLLQIVLAGQPELCDILNSYELRQLAQRITLSARLLPLTFQETSDYINHRIFLASERPVAKFSKPALRAIYNYSKGTPRIINIICDRALLTGFVEETTLITHRIIRQVIKEQGNRYRKTRGYNIKQILAGLIVLLVLAMSVGVFYNFRGRYNKSQTHNNSPVLTEWEEVENDTESNDFSVNLYETDMFLSRKNAAEIALSLWKNHVIIPDAFYNIEKAFDFFKIVAKLNNFSVYLFNGDLNVVEEINSPAIFEFLLPETHNYVYLTLTNIKGNNLVFTCRDNQKIKAEILDMEKYWSGNAYIFWQSSE
jgi:type II secretory pathway predicted ATPase ExeA